MALSMSRRARTLDAGPMIDMTLDPEVSRSTMQSREKLERSSCKRRANQLMHDRTRSLNSSEPIPFLCECDSMGCFSAVWLTGDAYDWLRESADFAMAVHLDSALSPNAFS